MRGVVHVPLVSFDGKRVGTVLIDKNGQMQIKMKSWARPDDVLAFLREIAKKMDQTAELQRKQTRTNKS